MHRFLSFELIASKLLGSLGCTSWILSRESAWDKFRGIAFWIYPCFPSAQTWSTFLLCTCRGSNRFSAPKEFSEQFQTTGPAIIFLYPFCKSVFNCELPSFIPSWALQTYSFTSLESEIIAEKDTPIFFNQWEIWIPEGLGDSHHSRIANIGFVAKTGNALLWSLASPTRPPPSWS